MSPEEVRELRGDLTRAEFAEHIGVTPLTVYRWELPLDRDESRRPQKRIRRRLREFQQRGPVLSTTKTRPRITESPLALELSTAERFALLPIFDDILNANWQHAEEALMEALASGVASTDASRVLTQSANALLKLVWRGDVRGAYSVMAPILPLLDNAGFAPEILVRAHTVAALLFSSADGLVFNAGRVNTHVSVVNRVADENEHEYRALIRVAEMWAAYNLGDAPLHDRIRKRSREDTKLASTAVVLWMVWEAGTLGAVLSGCIVEGMRFMKQLVDEAHAANIPLLAVRGTAFLAYTSLYASANVNEIDALTSRAFEWAYENRLEPGAHTVLLTICKAETTFRRANFEETERLVQRALEDSKRIQWAPLELSTTMLRLRYVTGRADTIDELIDVFDDFPPKHQVQGLRTVRSAVRAMSTFVSLDMTSASEQYRRAGDLAHECGTLPSLETHFYALSYYAALLSGDRTLADGALRRAERSIERLPFVWAQGLMRLYKAVHASLRGQPEDAEQHSAAAQSTFARAGDQIQLALTLRLHAIAEYLSDADDAQEQLDRSAAHMKSLGIDVPPPYQDETIKRWRANQQKKSGKCHAGTHAIAIPVDRLSVRGMSAREILTELFALLIEMPERQGENTTTIIEEVTGSNRNILHQQGDSEVIFIHEFGDGFGRRYRIGASDADNPDLRAKVEMLGQVTSLALEVAGLRALTNPATSAVSDEVPELPGVIAASESTQHLMQEISRLGQSRANVLITGESGSGKEVVAKAVHRLSTRSDRAFVTFNCSAVPRDLFEGQLFGYRKGAFTGATSNHPGVIRAADGGTLMLDEIGDLPLELQPKLLRFLENSEVFPLGETKATTVDVRVVAATHRDLREMVRQGTFREDLFYRLAVVTLEVLPLRERREDVLALTREFLNRYTPKDASVPKLSPEAASKLLAQPWPGNVRELRNVIERSLAFSPLPEVLGPEDLRF